MAETTQDTIADLPRLINERDALSDRIRALQQRKRATFAKFKVGDRIEWNHGLNGKRQGIVRDFCGYDHSVPDYVVDPLLKSGAKGRPFVVRSWHQPKLVEAAP